MTDTKSKEVELKPCPQCRHEMLHKRTTKTTVSMPVSIRCGLCDLTIEMQNWGSLVKFWNGLQRPQDNNSEMHGRCIKHGLFYCPHCEEMTLQPKCECGNRYAGEPKERKVSLEEIAKAIHHVKCHLLCPNERELIKRIGVSGVTYCKAQAILSLLNATEERKGTQ